MDERDELDETIDGCERMVAFVPVDVPERVRMRAVIATARAIRDRERKLAVLAHEMAAILKHDGMDGDTAMAWLRRYEEAVKDRARAEIGE